MKKAFVGNLFATTVLAHLAASLALGCGSPNVIGETIRPPTPTGASALQPSAEAVVCKTPDFAEPLLVDMAPLWHGDFQESMRKGVALVSYDCVKLKLLRRCHLEGVYGFAGIDRLENVIHLKDSTEIGVNAPLPLGISAGASLDRSTSLDVQYVLVGKQSTAATVLRSKLVGDECASATHFVSSATVGAFSVATGTKGSGSVAASGLGASASAATSSGKDTATKIGDMSACSGSKTDATSPPDNCGSAFRLELVPISDASPPKDAEPAGPAPDAPPGGPAPDAPAPDAPPGDPAPSGAWYTAPRALACGSPRGEASRAGQDVKGLHDPCPDGFKLTEFKCARIGSSSASHLCDPNDRPDCEAQCQAGNAGSCYNLANLMRNAMHGRDQREQLKAVIDMNKRACDGNIADACADYAYDCNPLDKDPCSNEVALKALQKACDMGSGNGCEFISRGYIDGDRWGLTKDIAKGMKYLGRACDLGDKTSCRSLGAMYFDSSYGVRDPAKGDKLLSQFCAQGDSDLCFSLGQLLLGVDTLANRYGPEKPVSEIADARTRGRTLLVKACADDWRVCHVTNHVLAGADDADARARLVARCPDDKNTSAECGYLGASLFDGKGGPADKKRGFEMMARSTDYALALRVAQMLQKGDGVKKNVKRGGEILERLCSKEHYRPACQAQEGSVKKKP